MRVEPPKRRQTPPLKPVKLPEAPRLPGSIGFVVAPDGQRLHLRFRRAGWSSELTFHTDMDQLAGRIMTINSTINEVRVEPGFRRRGYAAAMVDAYFIGLRDGKLPGCYWGFKDIYIRNPLLVRMFTARGFIRGLGVPKKLKREVVIALSNTSADRSRIKLYLANPEERQALREYATEPNNPDWHIFELVDEPITGEKVTIFASYILSDSSPLEQYLRDHPRPVTFYQ